MNTDKQPEVLRTVEALRRLADLESMHERGTIRRGHIDEMLSELRRLHALNQELLEALELALFAHGKMLLSDPPQEAWKTYGVESKARAAIAKAPVAQAHSTEKPHKGASNEQRRHHPHGAGGGVCC